MNDRFFCSNCNADFGAISVVKTKHKGYVWYCAICEHENTDCRSQSEKVAEKMKAVEDYSAKLNKSTITEEAIQIIEGDRRESYGEVQQSFQRFALAWTGYLKNKLKPGEEITPNDVAMLNVIGKALREGNKIKRDNRVDIIGYTLLADKLCQSNEEPNSQEKSA